MADEDRASAVDEDVDEQVQVDGVRATIHEITSSSMFSLDNQPDVADAEKLRYIHEALGQCGSLERGTQSTWMGSAKVHRGEGFEPYILVSRGEDFADSIDARFFVKTFSHTIPDG